MRRPPTLRFAALVLAGATALAACSSDDGGSAASTASTAATTAASGPSTSGAARPSTTVAGVPVGEIPADFFVAPDLPADGKPGTLLRSRPINAPTGSKGWAILYRSTAVDGTPRAVSGVVIVPDAPAPGPRPVLAWAHGTTGLGDACATSQQFATGTAAELAIVTFVQGQGLAFVATDYEGLGTPGPHPYLVNVSAGRNVLDSIRAVQSMPESGATPASRSVVWGHSQGGGAAAFAAEEHAAYAPELQLAGVAAGAPAADLVGFTDAGAATAAGSGYLVMGLAGLAAAYPDVALDRLLTDEGRRVVAEVGAECNDEIQATLGGVSAAAVLQPGATADPALLARLKENSAGFTKPDVPVLLYHGDADEVVPVGSSKVVLDRWCGLGADVSRTVYPGADHVSVILSAAFDLSAWFQARLAGTPATATC